MKDLYGREIDYLRISVTDRCNLRCKHCIPENGVPLLPRSSILSFEEILEVVSAAGEIGISKYRVTGGEPLIRKGICSLLRGMVGIPTVRRISLTTNGLLLKQYIRELQDLGINNLNISLHTLEPQRYNQFTRGGDFEKVWENINDAIRLGFHVKLNAVLMRNVNEAEIIEFARLTKLYPVHVRFIEFMAFGEWSCAAKDIFVSAQDALEKIKSFGKLLPDSTVAGSGPAQVYRLEGAPGTLGFITPVTQPFCRSCNRLRLTSDGRLMSCLLSQKQIDLKSVLKNRHTPGDIVEQLRSAIMLKPAEHHACRKVIMSRVGG